MYLHSLYDELKEKGQKERIISEPLLSENMYLASSQFGSLI